MCSARAFRHITLNSSLVQVPSPVALKYVPWHACRSLFISPGTFLIARPFYGTREFANSFPKLLDDDARSCVRDNILCGLQYIFGKGHGGGAEVYRIGAVHLGMGIGAVGMCVCV